MKDLPPLRLLASQEPEAAAPVLDAGQQGIVALEHGSGPVLVWGAPGTGKSTVLVETAVRRIVEDGVDPSGVLLLAPNRLAADRLRNRLTSRLQRSLSTAPARTWASYAFDVLRRAKVEGRLPYVERAPKLLSGPEQDLIIRELLEGHRHGLGAAVPWPEGLAAALGTRGFRQEIRQLFDRVIEYGISAAELAELGRSGGRQDWVAAAQLYSEYRDVIDLRMPEAFDPAGVITSVVQLFQDQPDFLVEEHARLALILVDDIQEANRSVHSLLTLLGRGRDVVVTASPDTVVQGFRGARPDLAGGLRSSLDDGCGVTEAVLSASHRMDERISEVWKGLAQRISQSQGGHKARRLEPLPATDQDQGGSPAVSAHLVASPVHEMRFVAERLLYLQLHEGRRLADMAVIVRTGGQLAQLQRFLSGEGIPVKVPVAENAVRDEAAVRPLLEAFRVVLDPSALDAETAVALLTSRIGRTSAVALRRLRQALRREERLGGGGRGSDTLLVEALQDPAHLASLGWEARQAVRIATMLAAGRQAAAQPGANAETVLWALWSESGCSDYWARLALQGGPAGVRADRDLDAMMALFQTAERYVDQLPGSTPGQFLEYLLNQELPMDTLAARAQRRDAVELLTPASAAGREWAVVVVPGLQDGVWPNTKLRGELLGSTELVEVLERGPAAARLGAAARLREIRYDELRSFSAAVSRARERLICTAVSSEDQQPSPFLDYVDPWEPGDDPGGQRPVEEVGRPMTLRSLVAELRCVLADPSARDRHEEAARVLGRLAAEEVPGAAPGQWWGLLPLSSTEPLVPAGGRVPVSPSKVDAVHKSPLNWFIQAAGGEAATDFARSLGTLVHAIAQDLPDASGSEYAAELAKRWPSLGMKENWEGQLDYRRAEKMVRKLAEYVIRMRQEGRGLLATEQDFGVELEGSGHTVLLRGQVDRLETDAEGRLVIVDLKTGRSKPTADELALHPQLGAYQAAVLAGAFDALARQGDVPAPGGAILAQLGTDTKDVGIQHQDALAQDGDWATPLVLEAASLMASATFLARHDPKKYGFGSRCAVPEVCPLCSDGKQVTE
ncbi:DEAD/DEAH box helicase [Paenarthrobacter sp. DKR-5]|uniref:ATP-dependent helicase n=1 Tax=Paenarthrobacter sp. DKR-5 TaxID=2835535 RepID=UPI001BDC2A35|nr:ATP-dependent DNA helicase [Paenarthrobacter sp. DKR-5]MBT1002950.1 DEAD/DEAH box helicase [Paenarthrobacter sp. DKR-5]